MKPSEIKDLIDFIDKSNLDEVNIETEQFKISAKKNTGRTIVEHVSTSTPVQMAAPTAAAAPVVMAAAPVAVAPAPAAEVSSKLIEIKSPMIGTFYRSASPESPLFVNIGDEVKKEQTVVCIIEAMKLFNEIESPISGRIAKVLVENNTPVEFDQVLFLVEPA